MKCQSLLFGKSTKKKYIPQCYLLKFLPSMLSVKTYIPMAQKKCKILNVFILSRGAELINRILIREVTKQKRAEKQILENIKAKMNQLKSKQKRLKESYIEPEDHFAGKSGQNKPSQANTGLHKIEDSSPVEHAPKLPDQYLCFY